MHPVLVDLGFATIHTYGVFIALAFVSAMGWTWLEARRKGLDARRIPDLAFAVFVGALVGSRLLYVLLYLPHFLEHPLEILMFWNGGMVFSGGAVLGAYLGWRETRKHHLPVLPWLDAVAPGLALGEAVGRLGCLSAGCCYGQLCGMPWAVTFTDPRSLAEPLNMPLHPTQAYHSLSGLAAFAILLFMRNRLQRPGQLMGLFLVLFCLARFSVEFFRADFRGELGPFSVTQVLYAAFLILGLILLLNKRTKRS
ncbi:MAG TPA: prolipoprotein diacylglyceryl transferase [Desulfovibrio sp.]|jgi:phosphatidylglycerol:prolipoprotein diacylglycerol transferase|nr:prolipoprotein diacylglyceryl transferase [Desulfovibrio sp.]HBR05760.1 prolipoprotein diacylglyceryl transferase [Desulfovibrio sp.]